MTQMVQRLPAMLETQVRSLGQEKPLEKEMANHSCILGLPWWLRWQKNPPAMQEIWVQSLGWDEPLEEGMATHSSTLAWRIPMDRGAWMD